MNPDTSLSRREFLKLAGTAAGGAVLGPVAEAIAASESLPRLLPGGRIMETAEGLIPVSDYRVLAGDSVYNIATGFRTRADLIVAANVDTVIDPSRIFPGQILKVPKYPLDDPMMFIPEADVLRHKVRPGETAAEVAQRYGILVYAVSQARSVRQGNDAYLTMRGVTVPSLIPVETNYSGDYLLPPEVTASLAQRIANIMAYYLGGAEYLGPLRSRGVAISHTDDASDLGYRPPNDIAIPLRDYSSREGWMLTLMGHEMGHELLDDLGWSNLSREGAAGRIGSGWVSGRSEYPPEIVGRYYEPGYYDSVNELGLRKLNNGSHDQRARILAVEAWRRIDEFVPPPAPGVLPTLIRRWLQYSPRSRPTRNDQIYNLAKVFIYQEYGSKLAVEVIKFIEQQHILFLPDFVTSFN